MVPDPGHARAYLWTELAWRVAQFPVSCLPVNEPKKEVQAASAEMSLVDGGAESITSAYFGSMMMALKLPVTSAASTNGLHRYRGLGAPGLLGGLLPCSGSESEELDGKVAEVGVVDRRGFEGSHGGLLQRCMAAALLA